jgi:flagellar biosynthetic protein FliR
MEMEGLMTFVFVLVRVASVLAFLPFLGNGPVPMGAKALGAVAISLVLLPLGCVDTPVLGWGPIQFLSLVAAEVLFGSLMGLSALLVFKALWTAGGMIGQQMGMALASVADPISGVESNLVAQLCDVVGVLVFFSVDGHHWMLLALRDSFAQWPLGEFLSAEFFKRITVAAVVTNVGMAFRLAAPLLLVAFTVSLLMAVMARLVPEVNVLIIGFPLRIGAGLVGLALFMPVIVRCGVDISRTMGEVASAVAAGT